MPKTKITNPHSSIARSPQTHARYVAFIAQQRERYGDTPPCPFCHAPPEEIVFEEGSMHIVKNNFPYSIYDGQKVEQHLLLTPKRHVASMGELTAEEIKDYFSLYVKMESLGYNAMTRSHMNTSRSIRDHVHTHQFKFGSQVAEQHYNRETGTNKIRFR